MLFGNGGYATTNHAILLSGAPTGAEFPQDFDCQAQADARRGPAPRLDLNYDGPATIETFTLFHDCTGALTHGVVVARTTAGTRALARIESDDSRVLLARAEEKGGPVGDNGLIRRNEAGIAVWKPAHDA